jgi:hypothetical protein
MAEWKWGTQTGRFSAEDRPGEPARVVVEQIGDASFRIVDGYGIDYHPRDGSAAISVTVESLTVTDFASIPQFASWFVSPYGRHTPAALVHDQLIGARMDPVVRRRADDLFLEMMEELDVPPVRRTVMWSAVTLATRMASGLAARLAMIAWLLLAVAGMVVVVAGLVTGHLLWSVAALVAPIPAALLWGPSRKAGVVGGYALPTVALPALASMLGYATYWCVEEGFRRIRSVPKSREVEEMPAPVGYKEL